MADLYLREDGTAVDRNTAIGPETDASACMTITTYKAGSKSNGDVLFLSDLGGDFTDHLLTYANDVEHRNIGSGKPFVISGTNEAYSTGGGRSGVTYDGVDGEGIENVMTIANLNDVVVQNIEPISNTWTSSMIRVFGASATSDAINTLIQNNTLTNPAETASMINIDAKGFKYDNFTMIGNQQTGGKYMYFASGVAGQSFGSDRFVFTDNIVDGAVKDIIITGHGLAWDGLEVNRGIIARNVSNNLGRVDELNTNAYGLQWCIGAIVEFNVSNGVIQDPAAEGDGSGFILDWAFRNDGYLCNGVLLRLNRANGHKSHISAPGIHAFKSVDGLIYCNACYDNSVGIKQTNGDATVGNLSYNNTVVDCTEDSVLMNPVSGQSALTGASFINNIFVNAKYNVRVQNQALNPTLDYNCYFGATVETTWNGPNAAVIPIGANSIELDPLFVDAQNNNYNLQKNSPCVGVGTKWWGNGARPETLSGEPLPDTKIDLGAYQSTWDANHPKNL